MEPGRYRANAKQCALGYSKQGTPYISVFLATKDDAIEWRGYLTEAAAEYTFKALRTMGWRGNDIDKVTVRDLHKPVNIVVEHEFDQNGNAYPKVKWINDPDFVQVMDPIPPAQASALAARLRGLAMKTAVGGGPAPKPVRAVPLPPAPVDDDDDELDKAIASAAPAPALQATGTDDAAPPATGDDDEELPF